MVRERCQRQGGHRQIGPVHNCAVQGAGRRGRGDAETPPSKVPGRATTGVAVVSWSTTVCLSARVSTVALRPIALLRLRLRLR